MSKQEHLFAKALACAFCVRDEALLLLRIRLPRHCFLRRDHRDLQRPHRLMQYRKTVARRTRHQIADHDCFDAYCHGGPAALTRRLPTPRCGDITLATCYQ